MSRPIVPEMVTREPWMTEELENKLKMLAGEGTISCAQVHRFAHEQEIKLVKMRLLLDACGIRLQGCQLGCF